MESSNRASSPLHGSRRSSRRTSALTSQDSMRRGSAAVLGTSTKRRITKASPDVNINEIQRMPRQSNHYAKVVAPDTDKVFKFTCSGEIGGDTDLAGKQVKWDATFSKPIEQFIYPSLQRFDVTSYEEKVKKFTKLHGHSPRNYTQSKSEVEIPMYADQSLTKHIKLDPIPDSELPYNEHIMFPTGPKWNLQVSDGDQHGVQLNERGFKSTVEEIEKEGELYMKNKISTHFRDLERDRMERERLGSAGFNVRRRGLVNIDASPLLEESANNLYSQLKQQQRQSQLHAALLAQAQTNITASGTEESSFHNIRKELLGSVPKSHTHLLDGIHYYRYMYESHEAQMEEKKAVEQAKMLTFAKTKNGPKRSVDSFANRLYRRKASQHSSAPPAARRSSIEPVSPDKAGAREDHSSSDDSSSDDGGDGTSRVKKRGKRRDNDNDELDEEDEIASQYTAEKLTRINRAMDTKNVGLGTVSKPNEKMVKGSDSIGTFGSNGPRHALFDETSVGSVAGKFEASSPYEKIISRTSRRRAQDLLLLTQLDEGVLPEKFIKAGTGTSGPNGEEDNIVVMLSKYGIGDTRGICLGKCLSVLHNLESVGLSDNRLTAVSLPTIIENLSHTTLTAIDLSFNSLHDQGIKALAGFLRGKTVLQDLDISSCGIDCADIKVLCNSLNFFPNRVDELRLSCNKIAMDGIRDLCGFLVSKTCVVRMLDLSWNNIGELGAIAIGQALRSNKTLFELNLASNSIGDYGGQRLIASLRGHPCMTTFILSQNGIADCTCFVVSQVLQNHPSMKRLDLTFNPLGEAGARSIYRRILRGLGCWVMMGNCAFGENPKAFNSTYPVVDNPYTLDLSEPYQAAVLAELLIKFKEDPINCSFEGLTIKEGPGKAESNINLVVQNNSVRTKANSQIWVPPESGIVRFNFQQSVFVPTLDNAIDANSLDLLQKIVEAGKAADRKKDVDKKKTWLYLLCQDVYFTTAQATAMIERFEKNKTIGDGELSKLDVIKSVWRFLLDTENMYTFLYENTTSEQRKDLVYALTLKRYKFNWSNPTGHWQLSLDDKQQRSIMMQIIAINNSESEFSKNSSNREDTSQNGNWCNFRNSKYTTDGETRSIVLDKEFLKNLPLSGHLQFDYVSTRRPPKLALPMQASASAKSAAVNTAKNLGMLKTSISANTVAGDEPDTTATTAGVTATATVAAGDERNNHTMEQALESFWKNTNDEAGGNSKGGTASEPTVVGIVSDEEFYVFLERLGLSTRKKIPPSKSLFVLLDLQLACTKHYFLVEHVSLLLDCFVEDWYVHSQVLVCMFSRIYDLHRMDIILRNLDSRTQQDVLKRLGYLNVINPLKISFDYVLDLMFLDNRIMVIALMELAAEESADQIVEDANTELPIAALYGAYNRTKNETRPEIMRFQFTDFGKHTKNVSWMKRRNLMKTFLVGTSPVDEGTYQVISQYKEMEAAGKLTEGPIDQQYLNYQKSLASSRMSKSSTRMLSAMRLVKTSKVAR